MVLVQKSSVSKSDTLLPPLPQKASPSLVAAHVINLAVIAVVLAAAYGFEDATAAMAFYGVYHREPWNQFIHFFGVPLILWSLMVVQAHLPIAYSGIVVTSLPGMPPHHVTYATFSVAFFIASYIYLDTFGGLIYMPIWYIIYATSVNWTANDQKLYYSQQQQRGNNKTTTSSSWMGTGRVLRWSLYTHFFAWYIQIVPGHKMIEGAQPAIMQSLGGALYTAPLFAFYEGIWFVGLRREFQQEVLALVAQYTQELCSSGVVMRACESL